MSIYKTLEKIEDYRKENPQCLFNGYLEDYLYLNKDTLEHDIKDIFTIFQKIHPYIKICVNFKVKYNLKTPVNKMLHITKRFEEDSLEMVVPYLLYFQSEGKEKAVLFTDNGYFYTAGLYYCLSEENGIFHKDRKNLLALPMMEKDLMQNYFQMFMKSQAGAVQRKIEAQYFSSYDDLYKKGLEKSKEIKDNEEYLYLKKVLYVQYMVNSKIREEKYHKDASEHRKMACMLVNRF